MKTSSLAIWYKPRSAGESANPKNVEAHFNLWKIPAGSYIFRIKRFFLRYLDIGLKLKDAKFIESVSIYIPAVVDRKDLKDLVTYIQKPELLGAVFNANLSITTVASSDYHDISNADSNHVFTLYQLDINSFDLDYTSEIGATIIKFKLNYTKDADLYVRFRISGSYPDTLSYIDKPLNSVLQSAFYRNDTIDFRANEIRVLKNKLVEKMNDEGIIFRFSKLHFFFICSSREEWSFSQSPYTNCRILENEKWKIYSEPIKQSGWRNFKNGIRKFVKMAPIEDGPTLAYHWKPVIQTSSDISDFNILFKTKYEQNDLWTISKYVVIALFLGLVTEIVGADVERWRHPGTMNKPKIIQLQDTVIKKSNFINQKDGRSNPK